MTLIAQPERCAIVRDSKGRSRGYAYIQLPDATAAARALSTMHGTVLGGKPIKVGKLNAMGEVVRGGAWSEWRGLR